MNISNITMEIGCPQCGSIAEDNNGVCFCSYCGYSNNTKGYGSLHTNKEIKIFKVPLTLVEKQKLLESENESLYLWDDNDKELKTLKGKEPEKYEDVLNKLANENNYYSQFYKFNKIDLNDENDIEEF